MTSSGTTSTKTVTAEIRVLVVDAKPVTLAMARQLDEVRLSQLDIMGRISLHRASTRADGWGPMLWVIGRSRRTGELVVARYDFQAHGNRRLHAAAAAAPLIVLTGQR